MTYRYTLSPYQDTVPLMFRDTLAFLTTALELPTPYRNTDPTIGEAYGFIAPSTLQSSPQTVDAIAFQFMAQAGFQTYAEGFDWATKTGMNLSHLLPQIKRNIDQRRILKDVTMAGDLYLGTPRSPIKLPNSSRADTWLMTVSAACRLELLIAIDVVRGHS